MPSYEILIAAFTSTISFVGLAVIIFQLDQQRKATRAQTYTALCALSYDILRLISDRPHLYPYFYLNKSLEKDDPCEVEVLMCCEMIANYCDNVALQRSSMERSVWLRWRSFIEEQVASSPALKHFLFSHHSWYSRDLETIVHALKAREDC